MAVTKTSFEWTASSSLTQTVPFEVIAAGDIDVYVEGVLQLQQNTTSTADATHPQVVSGEITQGTALTNYTVASNNGSITFNANLTVDDFVVIERTTDDTLLETFTSGSTVRARDLNSAFERVLFIAQEGVNIANEALAPSDDEDDALDAKGERISNVADATDDDDAVNRAQLGKVITDDLVAGEGIDLTDVTGGTNSGKQVTVSAELSTAVNPGVVKVNATSPITATYTNPGQLDLSIENNSIDIGKIQTDDIITLAEQNAGSPNPADTKLFTSSAAAKRFDTLVQTTTPSGSDYQVGKTWLQNDDELTLSIWNGNTWTGIASGGTFTNQPKVVYVDASSGNDNNDGHRISRPKLTIKAAVNQINNDATYGDGSVVIVAPGVYQEALPIQIEKKNVSIIGNALRSCIVHPTVATQESTMFELNSGSYIANLTLTGMKASGSLGNSVDSVLPTSQGWNFAFYNNAVITKSPYIQNCTNFSDSEIDNSNLNAENPAGGLAGDTDSAPTGGGLLVDGSVPAVASPLRSIVCDSYTHVGLNGPGILVTNNGYVQATSSYAFFNRYHIKCLNGGQANLAASTTDFGDQALVADGKSTTAIFTANTTANAAENDITFTVGAQTAGSGWFGDTTRPGTNMLVELGGTIYPILSAVANGAGWDVTISRPDPNNRSSNLGLDAAVASGSTAEFFLRSMIASSGHTMEYVGSGTDYRALPENGGVPDETKQITELNDGKVWTAVTDHNGKFKIGGNQTDDPIFEVDQQLGFVTIPEGSIAFNLLSDLTPQLGADLDVNGNEITSASNGDVTINPNGTGDIVLDAKVGIGTSSPQRALVVSDAGAEGFEFFPGSSDTGNTLNHYDRGSSAFIDITTNADKHIFGRADGEKMRINSSGRLLVGTTTTSVHGDRLIEIGNTSRSATFQAITTSTSGTGGIVFADTTTNDTGGYRGSIQYAHSSDSLRFNTAATERMRIDSSGNVGIGTASPLALYRSLSIHGPANDQGGVLDLATANQSSRAYVFTDSNGLSVQTATSHPILFKTNNSERLRIDTSGRVGIGESTPAAGLDVKVDTNPVLAIDRGSANTANFNLQYNGTLTGQLSAANADFQISGVGSSTPISFYANGSERMRITSSGVGIGTSSPSNLLHVNGQARFEDFLRGHSTQNKLYIADDIALSATKKLYLDSGSNSYIYEASADNIAVATGGSERLRITSAGLVNVSGGVQVTENVTPTSGSGVEIFKASASSGQVQAYNRDSSTPLDLILKGNNLQLFANGSERLRIDTSGRVGIGTSSPSNMLHLNGASPAIRLSDTGANGSAFSMIEDNNGLFKIRNDAGNSGTGSGIAFEVDASEKMRITSSGNIGIGDSAPGDKLTVGTTSDSSTAVRIQTTTTGNGEVRFGDSGSATAGYIRYAHNGNHLIFARDNTEAMRISSGGRVGIGTSSPAQPLDIVTSGADAYIRQSNGTVTGFVGVNNNNSAFDIYTFSNHPTRFFTNNTERFRIGNDGKVYFGDFSSAASAGYIDKATSGSYELDIVASRSTTTNRDIRFFSRSNQESMRIDTSGRLLFGTTSSSGNVRAVFEGNAGGGTGGGDVIFARNASTPSDGQALGLLGFSDNTHTASAMIQCKREGGTWSSSSKPTMMQLHTCGDGTTNMSERIRITSLGDVRIKDFSPRIGAALSAGSTNFTSYFAATGSGTGNIPMIVERYSDNGTSIEFKRNNSVVGNINVTASTTNYATSSDYRLKENVVDLDGAITRVKQLAPKRFNFIVDADTTVDGFLAHEAATVVPEAVTGTHNEVDDENNPVYQGIDQSKLVPLLTAALQEAIAKIETLETKVAALEAG